jgi:hypothetical protein
MLITSMDEECTAAVGIDDAKDDSKISAQTIKDDDVEAKHLFESESIKNAAAADDDGESASKGKDNIEIDDDVALTFPQRVSRNIITQFSSYCSHNYWLCPVLHEPQTSWCPLLVIFGKFGFMSSCRVTYLSLIFY